MNGNFLYSIKNLSKKENLVVSYYLYKICLDVDEYTNFEESQILYNALVSALGIENHSRKVIQAIIQKHKKAKFLTHKVNAEPGAHPFNLRGDLKTNYKEDCIIYDKCGSWNTESEEDINLVRAIFASKIQNFANIVAYTFFYTPEDKRKTFTIPEKIVVPDTIIEAIKDTSMVNLFIDSFKLSVEEGAVLNIAYQSHTIKELYPVFNEMLNHGEETRLSIYSKCTGISVKNIKAILRRDKKLISFDIMDSDGDIEEDAIDCIYAGDLNIFFCDVLKKDDKKEYYELNSFSVKEEEGQLALRLLKNGSNTNLLLYGSPGAGKTEYARSLVRQSGLTPYIFKNELEVDDNDNPEKHALSRLNCLLSLNKKDSVIIVDEAESMLSTRINFFEMLMGGAASNGKKGTVNTMLENSVNKVIWILNYTDPLDESTLRRFTYSIRFREMSSAMLRSIADSKLNKIKMSESIHKKLVDLCGKYHVTGASVDNMVKTVQGMDLSSAGEEVVVRDVQKVLEANSTLLFGKKKMRENVKDSYDLSILNTSIPAADIVNMVMNAKEFADKNEVEESGIRMLFYGLSGTGKTELARYIAEKLNKKICLKRVSDIMSPYVGENEQNIAKAFAEAEASGDVLLFDEADSFFSNRQDAMRSWERTLVNEFLTQMEEFSGILICTTNLKSIMDPAMQRRFHILTEFKPLEKDGIDKLLGRFFPIYKFDKSQTEKLVRYDSVTPGDFGSLAGKIRFMNPSLVSSEFIIDELCKIQVEKEGISNKKIGFIC
ncbi:MAG: AAA family ATPase [Treponema sp.]|nr:AAA family ATPase [Treponema sp.]